MTADRGGRNAWRGIVLATALISLGLATWDPIRAIDREGADPARERAASAGAGLSARGATDSWVGLDRLETSPGAPPVHGAFGVRSSSDRLSVWARPGRGEEVERTISARNPWDQRLIHLANGTRVDPAGERWYRILLPERPNGSTGWVRESDVSVVPLRHRIVVDLSEFTLKHYLDGELVHRFIVGPGRDEYPSPTGTFYVWARVPQADPSGAYGSYILGINGFSPVIRSWPGGGRAAIHGTDDPSDPGRRVSFGCIRVYNPQMDRLRGVPLGTPVIISA